MIDPSQVLKHGAFRVSMASIASSVLWKILYMSGFTFLGEIVYWFSVWAGVVVIVGFFYGPVWEKLDEWFGTE